VQAHEHVAVVLEAVVEQRAAPARRQQRFVVPTPPSTFFTSVSRTAAKKRRRPSLSRLSRPLSSCSPSFVAICSFRNSSV
jgi:hypothetical protein